MHTSARSAFLHYSRTTSLTSRTAVYGPVRTVVWQGSAGDCRPYADPGPGQCIGFYPPAVSAECDGLNSAYVTDLYDNVGWLGDMHRQIAKLPDGAKVRIVVQPPTSNS